MREGGVKEQFLQGLPHMAFLNKNAIASDLSMNTRYKLLVEGVGDYGADSLFELFWIVLKHRCEHFFKGEGFRD